MARQNYTAPPPGFEPINTIQPIRRGPKTPGKRLKVRFEGDPSTPGESESINAPNTPAFVFNTPKDKKMMMSKKDEFQNNVNKEKFNTWMKVLHESRWRKTSVKAGLVNFELPTKLINNLYEKRAEDREPWKALVSSHSHNGFLNRSGLIIPTVDVTEHTPRDWEKEGERDVKVLSESLIQQKDGKCKICRGFKWAGAVLIREISEGQEVPCYSQHKSVKPYTSQELQEFGAGDHSSLFRRWCQESRWDWLFEDPPLDGLDQDGKTWTIPKDDPRLRHVTRLNEVTKFYDADRMEIYEGLKLELSAQDLAAKRFIDAIAKSGNLEVANKLKQMDMERKRRQVQVKYLCVRQVKLIIRGQEAVRTRTGKRPASDADLQADNRKKQRGIALTEPAPKPAARRFANPRKPFERANGNVKNKHTASIIPPTILEPFQRIPAPFDPVELKKIRLAPSINGLYKSPETRYRERLEEEMRFRRKLGVSRTYSTKEAELEAEVHVENCKKAELHRIEEEKLRAKEIEEEKARAKGKPEDPATKLPGRTEQFYNPTPLPIHTWIPMVAKKTRSFRQIGQKSNPFERGGQKCVPIRGERDRGSHVNVGVSNVVKPGARKEKGVQDMGGHGDSLFSLFSHRQNKMASLPSRQKLRERFLAHQEELKQYQQAVRIDPFWKRPEDPREILLRQENQRLHEQAQLRLESAARVEAGRESRDRRAREADVAAEERMVGRVRRGTVVVIPHVVETIFSGVSAPIPVALPAYVPVVAPVMPEVPTVVLTNILPACVPVVDPVTPEVPIIPTAMPTNVSVSSVNSYAIQAASLVDPAADPASTAWSAPPMPDESDSDSWFGSESEDDGPAPLMSDESDADSWFGTESEAECDTGSETIPDAVAAAAAWDAKVAALQKEGADAQVPRQAMGDQDLMAEGLDGFSRLSLIREEDEEEEAENESADEGGDERGENEDSGEEDNDGE